MSSPTRRVLGVVFFVLLVFVVIGLPNAVLAIFVSRTLGYSTAIAGLTFSLQYLATFLARPWVARMVDRFGPKASLTGGLAVCALSGLFMTGSGLLAHRPALSLCVLMVSRLALGWAEAWTATGAIVWNIRRAGPEHTAVAISWNGICSYGGIALGAPIGAGLATLAPPFGGLVSVGLLSTALPVLGLAVIGFYEKVPPSPAAELPLPFLRALRLILPHGLALACGSVGFGAISSFLALYYAVRQWDGAATALAAFGILFVVTRLLFAAQIKRRGGVFVAIVSLLIESAGLGMIWLAPCRAVALAGAALAGMGFSLVFPALGVLAVEAGGPRNRAVTLGAYSVFLDIAIALSGLALGQVIDFAGYGPMFALTAACCLAGVLISKTLDNKEQG